MVELSKKLGKLSLAILENFVEGVLGEKFVDELRLTTDRAIAIAIALGEAETLFLSTFGDEGLSRALFVDLSQNDRPELRNAVGRYFDHPTDPSLRQSLQRILFDEFKSILAKEEIDKAVDFYLKLLTKELMLADEAFRDNIAALAHYEGNLAEQQSKELLEQIAAQIMVWQNASQSVFRSLHQLPPVPLDFTGRNEILHQLLNDIDSQKGATISGLVGMGGIGKTVLGLAAAHRVATSYPDAQIFLDLKGTSTPLSALDIARHVILAFEPTTDLRTAYEADVFGMYQSILHGKKALLFFDNARSTEQIKPVRPPETCAMLITSRWAFTVPGVSTRRVGVMSKNDAENFLLELCPRIGDNATELAMACSYLPLALRIAGSFLQVNIDWPIEKYLAQLSDRRQRLTRLKQSQDEAELTTESDLITTFELSYDQLSEENRKYWCMLGVFPTSFDLNAAQNVWGSHDIETAKLLSLLRRYSLLDYDESSYRYYLHDLLADYALEQMNSDEKIAAQIVHSLHYSKLLTTINGLFLKGGENIVQSLKMYDTELINLDLGQHISVEYLESNHDAVLSCNNYALQGSINGLRQRMNDRIRWLEDGLKASKTLENKQFISSHLNNLGIAYSELGQTSKAIGFYSQHLAIARENGNQQEQGVAWGNIGVAYLDLGDIERSVKFLERALEIARETGDHLNEGGWVESLGNIHAKRGNLKKAIEFYDQGLNIAREIGNLQGESSALGNIGAVYEELGETSKAMEFQGKSMEISRKIGDRHGESRALGNLGVLHAKLGDLNKAIDFFKQHYEIAHEMSNRLSEVKALENLGITFTELGDFNKTIDAYEQAVTIYREIGNRKEELMILRSLGNAYAMIGTLDIAPKAIEVSERQLALAREIKDSDAEAAALSMLGFLNYNIGEKGNGIMLTKQALGIFETIGSPTSAVNAIRHLLKQWGVEEQGRKRRKKPRVRKNQ